MDTTNIYNAIAIAIAIVSLIILIIQTQKLEHTIRSQVYQSLIDNSLKIDQLLIENPEFRKYIYECAILDENTPDYDKIMGVLDLVVDVIDGVKAQEKYIPNKARPGWEAFANEVLKQPAVQHYLSKTSNLVRVFNMKQPPKTIFKSW